MSLALIACNNGGDAPDSPKSAVIEDTKSLTTMTAAVASDACVQSPEYWATHNNSATTPANRIPWPAVAGASSPTENTTLCGESWLWRLQSADSSLKNRLAVQYIAAKLNIASGASAPTEVKDALKATDRIFKDKQVSKSEEDDANLALLTLTRYNAGLLGVDACETASLPTVSSCAGAKDGTPCDDYNECTDGDSCWDGNCIGGNWKNCDDGNVCTQDNCNPDVGCVNNDNTSCDDGNACTKDVCDPKKGCTFPPDDGLKCDDGNVCTTKDQCSGGQCTGVEEQDCDDGDPCTVDVCEQAWGCMH